MNTIYHYEESMCKTTGYPQNSTFEREDLHMIIDHILEVGLNVMITRNDNGLTVCVDGK